MKSLLLPLLAAGCVANDLTLTIDRFVPVLEANSCQVSPGQSDTVAEAVLDVGLVGVSGRGYIAFPVVTNHLASSVQGGIERHSIVLRGANVELQPDSNLSAAIPPAQRKFFASVPGIRIDPTASVTAGVEVIPFQVASALGSGATGTINALVAPVGDYSGDTVVGAAVGIPVHVCSFCLSGQPASCPAGGFDATAVMTTCIASQDANVTCCVDGQNRILCGDQVPVKTM
jgi:hypothetical protein